MTPTRPNPEALGRLLDYVQTLCMEREARAQAEQAELTERLEPEQPMEE